ncbi:MAG: MiaB/RimO family radical SAM methylthiotransferase [Candidatus Pacebacteria bacterium]|nr:MiaB/RimO family radical SAM methylthiotransferase [Candidatus Paceibacterota bacterium]
MKCFIVTFGCQTNEADSERIAAFLDKKGYSITLNQNEADLFVVNMCSVRQSAVDRVFGIIQKIKKIKSENPRVKTILTGCILNKDKNKFKEFFDEIVDKKYYLKYSPKYQSKSEALIPISNGCNNFCSYCAVPYVRGPLICIDHKKILKEVKRVAQKGFKEVWLLGQNVNDYTSPSNSIVNFPKLLKMAGKIPGDFKIRFTSPHPKNFSNELIDVMANSDKIAKYINLPVQSGDDSILKKMNRKYTVKQYKDLVKRIRKGVPEINLSTDVIIGFPGETKKQFENTAKLFKEISFNIAYINKYSPRPGTLASKMADNVPWEEKKRREKVLIKLCLAKK